MIRPALVLTALAALSGCAARSASPDPAPNARAVRASFERGTHLRVMTFNIQSARHGFDAVAELIRSEQPDIVALQEVDKGTQRSIGLDQAKEIAARAGYPNYAHVRAATLFGGDYGVAVLSKHPLVSIKSYALPTTRRIEPRTVAHAVVSVEGREVSVYVTHLSNATHRSELRTRQAQFIARLAAADPRPKVITGDLNDAPESPALLLLTSRYRDAFDHAGEGDAETYPLPFPLPHLRLDYVLASDELRARRAYVVRKLASDHYPLVADFELAQPAPATLASGSAAGAGTVAGRANP